VHLRPLPWLVGRRNPPPDQAVHWHLVGSHSGDKGGDNSLCLHNPGQWAPKKCCRKLGAEMGTLRQISRKQLLLCQHRPSGLISKAWALRTKGSHFIYPCKQFTEAESKAGPTCGCMWLHWLVHFPSAMWPSCFNSLSFISLLCHPCSLSCRQNTVSLFFFWSPRLSCCRLNIVICPLKWSYSLKVNTRKVRDLSIILLKGRSEIVHFKYNLSESQKFKK
jgi:hypothetical protein